MKHFDGRIFETACATCNLRELCIPSGMSKDELNHLSTLVSSRRRLKRGDTLIEPEQEFDRLYAIHSGFFKTTMNSVEGSEQVVGFQIPGEILGLDGVSTGKYGANVTALEDSEVCVLLYADLEQLTRECQPLQRQLHRVMSREIVSEQHMMMLLGTMRAEQRVAAFLLNLSERFKNLGYSPISFVLRMTRQELGSYLGLKLETVSRILSRLHAEKLILVKGKNIELLNTAQLRSMMNSTA